MSHLGFSLVVPFSPASARILPEKPRAAEDRSLPAPVDRDEATTGRSRVGLIASVIVLSVLIALTFADAATQAGDADVQCQHDIDPSLLEWQTFMEEESKDRSRLFFSKLVESWEGPFGHYVRSEVGRCLGRIDAPVIRVLDTCHHPESSREHTVLYVLRGAYVGYAQVWSIHPATGNPVMDYDEIWGEYLMAGEGLELLIAANGSCLWQDRQRGRNIFNQGMAPLRVGEEVSFNRISELTEGMMAPLRVGEEVNRISELPTRIVPTETVRKWLKALDGIAELEGAVYASDADRDAWRVVQVLGVWNCDAKGVVLLLDRKTRVWKAIYDVPSGCAKTHNFPLRGMTVKDNRLLVSACLIYCGDHGGHPYMKFAVDLHTSRVTPQAETWIDLEDTQKNPSISDIAREAFSD